MPTNLAQWERERFLYGDAAGDGKGDLLRVHAIKAEHASNLVFSWLSGGASEVTLPNALPISRGGTGMTANPAMLVNLASASTANVFGSAPRPGVTGTLPVSHGGTGATAASANGF